MAFISEEDINKIRNSCSIVDVIGDYIKLTKSGSDYVGMCPFHDDHSPSMHVSTKLGIFKCFVCNAGGNVFSFVKRFENVSYPEAIKIVADKSGISLNVEVNPVANSKFQKEFNLMDLSLKFYQNNLATASGKTAKEYLKSRGIDEQIIKDYKFGLAFANNKLREFLESKKQDLDLASELGLLNKDGINYYDMFVDRIMIPIFDMNGNLAGYTARCYLKDEKSKYINSKETVIYKKSNILFNYYFAKNEARLQKEIIIVEGNMDAISLAASGIKNVCALMGVVVSQNQIDALKKLNSRVVLVLDSDNAGSDATIKVGEQLFKAGIDLYIVRLSGAKDPDEYIRKYGADAFKDNIKHAVKYLDFKLEYLKQNRNLNNTTELTEYLKQVIDSLENADAFAREVTISKICQEYNISPDIINKQLKPIESKVQPKIINTPVKTKKNRYELATQQLIYAMLLNREYAKIYMDKLGYLRNKVERDTALLINGYIKKHNDISISGFIDYIMDNEEVSNYINTVIAANIKENIEEKEFYDILMTVSNLIDEEEIKELQIKIKKEQDINKKIELITRLTELKKGCGNNEGN